MSDETQQSQEAQEPLPETQPTGESISELFNRDPMELTDEQLDGVIARLREERANWQQREAEGKTRGRQKSASKQYDAPKLSLDELLRSQP